MKRRIGIGLLLVIVLALPVCAQTTRGSAWSFGPTVPTSCSGTGGRQLFYKTTATQGFYQCLAGSYVSMAAGTYSGGPINMALDLITNIGDAGTDFTAGGGLTLAGNLKVVGANSSFGRSTVPYSGAVVYLGSGSTGSYDLSSASGATYGLVVTPSARMTGNQSTQYAGYFGVVAGDDGNPRTLTTAIGLHVDPTAKGANVTITNNYGLKIGAQNAGSTSNYGAWLVGPTGAGVNYTLYVDPPTLGTKNIAIHNAGVLNQVGLAVFGGVAGTALSADVTAKTATTLPVVGISNSATQATEAWIAFGATTYGTETDYFKTRATAATDADTVVVTGDIINSQRFWAADGADYKEAAKITTAIEGTVASGRVPGSMKFYTALDAAGSALTLALTIDSSQKATFTGGIVGGAASYLSIGTNPSATGEVRLANNTNVSMRNAANSADIVLGTINGSNHYMANGNTLGFGQFGPMDDDSAQVEATIGASSELQGLVVLTDRAGGQTGVFISSSTATTLISATANAFGATKDTDGKFNFYVEGGKHYIQNKIGANARTINMWILRGR